MSTLTFNDLLLEAEAADPGSVPPVLPDAGTETAGESPGDTDVINNGVAAINAKWEEVGKPKDLEGLRVVMANAGISPEAITKSLKSVGAGPGLLARINATGKELGGAIKDAASAGVQAARQSAGSAIAGDKDADAPESGAGGTETPGPTDGSDSQIHKTKDGHEFFIDPSTKKSTWVYDHEGRKYYKSGDGKATWI